VSSMTATNLDFEVFTQKGEKKSLTLEFDGGEEVIASLKQALLEHGVSDGRVKRAEGNLKNASVAYFSGNEYRNKTFPIAKVLKGSGQFKKTKEGYFGDLKTVIPNGNDRIVCSLLKAEAEPGFVVEVEFLQF